MLVERLYTKSLKEVIRPGKAIIIVGPRRAGKTTFLKHFLEKEALGKEVKLVLGDNLSVQRILSSRDQRVLSEFVSGVDILAIDEVHFIPEAGYSLKLLIDTHPNLKILATGSASLDIVHKIGEPLVGRKITLKFYPFSIYELRRVYYKNDFDLKEELEEILIYGLYPEIFLEKNKKRKELLLRELVDSYLLRDILALENLRYPFLLQKLLQLLAFQIGNLVSYSGLAREVGIDVKTVEKYLWLLEKSFVIKRVPSFSRNLGNEIKKSKKYYFLDLGVRNALIHNFASWEERNDRGQLWENFLFIERIKRDELTQKHPSYFFWRTKYGQEIDLVEMKEGKLFPYEFKLKREKSRGIGTFKRAYPESEPIMVVNRDNFLNFIG